MINKVKERKKSDFAIFTDLLEQNKTKAAYAYADTLTPVRFCRLYIRLLRLVLPKLKPVKAK